MSPAPTAPGRDALLDDDTLDAYLRDLDDWRARLSDTLLELDEHPPTDVPDVTADLALAFMLWRAASERIDAVIDTRGKGPATDVQRDTTRQLLWTPVLGSDGSELAANLPEAGALLDALVTPLQRATAARGTQLTAVAALLAPVTERVDAAARAADQLGEMANQVAALAHRLRRLGPQHDVDHVTAEVASIDVALGPIERDLAALARSKASMYAQTDEIAGRSRSAVELEQATRVLAERCRAKVVDTPRLAIPSVAAMGPVPTHDEIGSVEWRAGLSRLATFEAKLARVEAALTEANTTYAAPLQRRDDMRGLLASYRAMAASRGLAEDPEAALAYEAAKAALWQAPCDVAAAAELVTRYQQTVLRHAAQSRSDHEPATEDRR